MYCIQCGKVVPQGAKFCPGCGAALELENVATTQASETSVQPSKTPWFVILEITLIGITFIWAVNHKGRDRESIGPTPTVTEQAPAVTEQAPTVTRHRIGDDFSVGYWSYHCNGGAWWPFIASGYGSVERPDAAFLVLDLTVRNNDRTASILPPLKLVDSQGREFDESSKGIFLNGAFGALKKLNPGVSSRGLVVFDVPSGEYTLKVSGGIESGDSALIVLAARQSGGARWANVTVLGFKAGESAKETGTHAVESLGMTEAGNCKERRDGNATYPEYVDCEFLGSNSESLQASFYSGQLQRLEYTFPLSRYDTVLEQISKAFGKPRSVTGPHDRSNVVALDWGGFNEGFDISMGKRIDGTSGSASVVFNPGKD